MNTDHTLLLDYAATRSEAAFNELLSRHLPLVYSTAVRLLGGDSHLAQDAAQTVFLDLSRRAGSLTDVLSLAGWLHRHTFFVCSVVVRRERRRKDREMEAGIMNQPDPSDDEIWARLSPILDESIAELNPMDRDLIVMRFFQGLSWNEVGRILGTSDDTAQKRASRALEKLRAHLVRRGPGLSSAALIATLGQNAVNATPIPLHLVSHISSSVAGGTTAGGSGIAVTWLKSLAWMQSHAGMMSGGAALICVGSAFARLMFHAASNLEGIPAADAAGLSRAAAPAATVAANGNGAMQAPPFLWRDVESGDYREYVARLRRIGCPEETIRDLLIADLNQAFAPRMAAIWNQPKAAYWKKFRGDSMPGAEQLSRLESLEKEKAEILSALLGTRVTAREFASIGRLSLDDSTRALAFLEPRRLEVARRALEREGLEDKLQRVREFSTAFSFEIESYELRRRALSGTLTSEELEEFDLRFAPRANWLRHETSFLDCTREEFRALLELREQRLGPGQERMTVDRAEAVADVRKVMGAEKAAEFEIVSDHGYTNARRAAERAGLPQDLADLAGRIVQQARVNAEGVARQKNVPADERSRRIGEIAAETEQVLSRSLGSRMNLALRQAAQLSIMNMVVFIKS